MLDIHRSKCPNSEDEPRLQVSCDGVSESRSTSVSLDVYSARSTTCQVPYPFCLVRPNVRFITLLHYHRSHYNKRTLKTFYKSPSINTNTWCMHLLHYYIDTVHITIYVHNFLHIHHFTQIQNFCLYFILFLQIY